MTPLQFTRRRKKLFRTQAQAAEALGITPGQVSHLETGRRAIPRYVEIILACLESKTVQ